MKNYTIIININFYIDFIYKYIYKYIYILYNTYNI